MDEAAPRNHPTAALSRRHARSIAANLSPILRAWNFAFETTLGGTTITKLLADAVDAGIDVHIWYVALESPDLHLARVRERVSRGGHDIPERDVRRRYDASRQNLIELLHGLASLRVYDNSADADPAASIASAPKLLLHMERGRIVRHCDLATAPEWAKPILLTALTALGDPGE